jgi:uncharacterized protein with ATP-grasp and redox domains
MYDIFYVSADKGSDTRWNLVKNKYPTAQRLSNIINFEQIKKKAFTNMFWVIWDDLIVNDSFDITSHKADKYDDIYVHVFKNGDYYDGICLFPKKSNVSQKEFDYRYFMNKKEIDIVASYPVPVDYDIIFISYDEIEADSNYQNLLKRFPRAKRVHGVKGIHQAHIQAAKISDTELFYVVDADAIILDTFNFDYKVSRHEKNHVHVWYSKNPINDLIYGYGGVKLFPKNLTMSMDVNKTDMTTSISKNFKSINEISNITKFNTDPFSTRKSAFRECAKLSSKIIERQVNNESEQRLSTWCTVGIDKPFGEYAIKGAIAGKEFGIKNKDNQNELFKINDFNWLKDQFNAL